jgi:6-hydroxycyclohex-1-ene-1-carbonyl-CoA dehydrogenase
VPDSLLTKYSLEKLSVIADAISTPYQVIRKSELEAGDFAIVIGVGGVGVYAALIAKIFGAKVLALDIDDVKLNVAKSNGIDAVLNIKGLDMKSVKEQVREIAKGLGVSRYGWKIFEMSGTKPGQELGFNLITFTSTLSVVGFTLDRTEVRLSNLMAFDAKLIGTWGCKPELYTEVVNLIATDKLRIDDFIETFPLSEINEIFSNTLKHLYTRRPVMVPDQA